MRAFARPRDAGERRKADSRRRPSRSGVAYLGHRAFLGRVGGMLGETILGLAKKPLAPLELRQNRLAQSLVIFIGHVGQHGLDV